MAGDINSAMRRHSPAGGFGEGITNGRHQKGKTGRSGKRSHKEIL
jgi:hypothetical protein